jgi:uncharacterized protein (TIGR02452 family)
MQSSLISVFADTRRMASKYTTCSTRYGGLLIDYTPQRAYGDHGTAIVIKNVDCIDECVNLIQSNPGDRVGLLNMASDICAGGGVAKGSRAQEEDICRRTSLYPSLKKLTYPLEPMELVFSPDVFVL